MEDSVRDLVVEYCTAAGERRYDRLAELVHPDAVFGGTVKGEAHGAEAFVQGFRNLGPITVRHEVREVVADGDRAYVMYDLVTNTAVGSVLCGELVHVRGGRVASSTLIFDWRRWPEVMQELQQRASDVA
ncbi:MAG TPA: nuclear transport factor 2 family protein [Actinomycetota bacterium]|nr:nuclear transport factor 2 family protein [Actinomycetota bacterium]